MLVDKLLSVRNLSFPLICFILMDCPIDVDIHVISMEVSIVYFKGFLVNNSTN